ncbi:hypothetical protein LM597_04645, partial [Candidatus Acetothermia bacterium]|nr:hypothetical protein [Candidatus Acetothermia bacterium]
FGAQCPWYRWVIDQASQAARELGAEVTVKDVMDHPELAERHRMFFPFMTVIDGNIRISAPVSAEVLIRIAKGTPEPKPTSPMAHGERAGPHLIHKLTPENIKATIPLCIANVRPIADREKVLWTKEMLKRSGCAQLGFIAFQGEKARGVVEYLPSSLVPYPLPKKDSSIAFITCIYPTKPDVDYKSPVLKRLLAHLREEGYKELHVIAGRQRPYPNGPLSFFRRHGFVELGEVDQLCVGELDEEELILMRREL